MTATACEAHAAGIFDAMSGVEEPFYTLFTTKTRDIQGTTTKTETVSYGLRNHFRLNYNLLPTLNLNAGGTYDKTISELSSDTGDVRSEITRTRPFVWLTLRDPVISPSVGYDLAEDALKIQGQGETRLTRDTYTGNVFWRPLDLPTTQARYTHSITHDGERAFIDTKQDQVFVKSEYAYRGLSTYYAATFLDTRDDIRDVEVSQTTHEGKLLYTTTFLDGRVSATTDNRIRYTTTTTDRSGVAVGGVDNPFALAVGPVISGLVSFDNNTNNPLAVSAQLATNDVTTPVSDAPPGGATINLIDPTNVTRNLGLNFGSAQAVSSLRLWVIGDTPTPLPSSLASLFTWQVFTSANNVTWTLHATVPAAPFGPFASRFQIDFPVATAQYIKVAVKPLAVAPPAIAPNTRILVTRLDAFLDTSLPGVGRTAKEQLSQLTRTHNLDVRVLLLRIPSLYYRFNGDYQEFDEGIEPRYNVSNGLFLTHRFNPVFSTAVNGSFDIGSDRGEPRSAALYYAALTATPLRTLTDSLVFSGNRQWAGGSTQTSDSVVLYNTAQLYRGIDVTLNFGTVFASSQEESDAPTERRQESYVNLGASVTPHPTLTFTSYYTGKQTHTTGGPGSTATATTTGTASRDTTENRLDLGMSFTPFPTLVLSAGANITTQTGQDTSIIQSYGLNWAPFPDGNLQFSFFFSENRLSDNTNTRILQPGVRWYFTSKRRSFWEASYQITTVESPSLRSESQGITTRLNYAY